MDMGFPGRKEIAFLKYLQKKGYDCVPEYTGPTQSLIYPFTHELGSTLEKRLQLPSQPDFAMLTESIIINTNSVEKTEGTRQLFFTFDHGSGRASALPFHGHGISRPRKTELFDTLNNPVYIKT